MKAVPFTVGERDVQGQVHASRTREAAFTEGPIARTLLLFSLPILASSVLQSLNASINAAWIGHLLGSQALTASANANSLLFLLLSLGFGLGMAATILVGQAIGASELAQAKRVIGTTFLFFVALSAVTSTLGFLGVHQILHFMRTPADAEPLAAAYLKVIFLAIPPMFLFTFMIMALRGAGDARTPFAFMALAAVLDTCLNPLLIRGLGPIPALGIAGSAVASLISQWISLILMILWLYARRHQLRITVAELEYLRIDPVILRGLLVKGVPMGLQVIVVSSSMLALISLVNRYGSVTVAAYGACFQLWNYISMPAMAIGSAVSSMAAQNVGAGRWDRLGRIVIAGVVFNIILTGVLIAAVAFSDSAAFTLFLGHNTGAIATARHMNLIVSWSYILFGISFVLSSVVRTTGAVVAPLLILFVAVWGIRLPAAVFLSNIGVDGILWAFPAGSIASLIMTAAYYRFGHWRAARMLAPA